MKRYINGFKNFEAIIIPDIKLDSTLDDIKEIAIKNNVKVGSYKDINNPPPKFPIGPPYFSYFDIKTGDIVFIINNDGNIIPSINEFLIIIGHENIHRQQDKKHPLPNPDYTLKSREDYYSNKYEIMAFSWSIANDLFNTYSHKNMSISEFFKKYSEENRNWFFIKRIVSNSKTLNRYKKYIYLYLQYLFDKSL